MPFPVRPTLIDSMASHSINRDRLIVMGMFYDHVLRIIDQCLMHLLSEIRRNQQAVCGIPRVRLQC